MSGDPSHPGRPGGWVAHSPFCPCAPADARRRTQSWMTLRPALPLLFVLASACGSSSPSTPAATTCPAHCPTGQVCGSAGTCVPLNSSGGSAPLTCSQADKPVRASSFPTAVPGATSVIFQGTRTVGDTMTFTVPSNTASLTIVEQATKAPDVVSFNFAGSGRLDTDNVAVPQTVRSFDGSITFDDLADGSVLPTTPDYYASHSVFFFSDSPATGTLTIPNTSRGLTVANGGTGLPPGSWSMVVSDLAWECQTQVGFSTGDSCLAGATDSTYDVTVIAKPADGGTGLIPASGNLDVVVYFATASAGGLPLTQATAPSDPDLTRLAATLKAIYAQQQIKVATVTFKDLLPEVQAQYLTGVHVDQSGACAELPQLLKNAAPGNTFNAFLVSDFIESTSTTQGSVIVGIDGTIPGPASIGGTVASGAAVSVADLRGGSCQGSPDYVGCGADRTAYIIAHEAGHFLGLYHVTEQYGAEFDPLLDTPTCPCTVCSNAPSTCADPAKATPPASADTMRVSECLPGQLGPKANCGGGDNLMFWLVGAGSQGKLTTEQGQVIRANPLVH